MRLLTSACLLCTVFATSSVHALADMYTVVSAGYSDADFDNTSAQSGGYKFAIGYEIDSQWYAEFGYQKLSNQSQLVAPPASQEGLDNADFGLQGDAIFAALLGKARGSLGELFYRVGVLNTDVKGQSYTTEPDCAYGNATPFSVGQTSYQFCEYDEGGVAGVFGIGFDFYLGTNAMLRTEIEHVRGQNDLRTNAAYLGLRYNF